MSKIQLAFVGFVAIVSLLMAIIVNAGFLYIAVPCALIIGGYAVWRLYQKRLMPAGSPPTPSASSGGMGGIIWFFASLAVLIAFVVVVTAGVAIHDAGNKAGRMVVLIACLASACYFAIVALMLARRPDIWRRPLSWFGIEIVGAEWPKKWRPFVQHFFVLPTIPTLALLLTIWTSWTAYVLGLIGTLLILSMYFISLKEGIAGGFWKKYYDFLGRRWVYIVAAFLIYVPFEASWTKLGRYAAKQFGVFADWVSSPKAKAVRAGGRRSEPKASPRFSKNFRPARSARKTAEEPADRVLRNSAPKAGRGTDDSEFGRIMANEKKAREEMEDEIRKLNQ